MKYNLVQAVEFDKYCIKSYNAIHGTNIKPTDIRNVEKLFNCDFLTYSFPCTDISQAGKQAGIKENTRSGLLYEVERLLQVSKYKPKFLLMENVKNLIGKKHKLDFDILCSNLNDLGYVNYWEVLNAKYYNIPQNRERIFMLSIRKDIDNGFTFPKKQELKLKLRDLILDKVDAKFYLNDVQLKRIKHSTYLQNQRRIQMKEYCDTLCARDWKDPKCIQIKNLEYKIKTNVRKMTPQEYWRLMGISDEYFFKAKIVNSNSQLYCQAGNAIVVNVLSEIYKQIQKYYPNDFKDGIDIITLFSGIGTQEIAFEKI